MISLTTDFGTADGYVAVMKAIILGIDENAQFVDISHEIEPCDIVAGAWVLNNSYRFFPSRTIHLAVIDPGVGSPRRPIILQTRDHFFVGPDNGLFTHIIEGNQNELRAFEIDRPQYWREEVSHTFHGRDIFAPIAGQLESGESPKNLGTEIQWESLRKFRAAKQTIVGDEVVGSVVYIDRFGNLITNIEAMHVASGKECIIDGHAVPLGETYSSAAPGELVGYVGSHGCLEIGAFGESAKNKLQTAVGAKVRARRSL